MMIFIKRTIFWKFTLPVVTFVALTASNSFAQDSDREKFVDLCQASDGSQGLALTFAGLRNVDWERFEGDCGELYDFLLPRPELILPGGTFQRTEVGDLSPLALLPNLRKLDLSGQRNVYDLAPLSYRPLTELKIQGVDASIWPLQSMQLEALAIDNGSQLEPLRNLPLETLTVTNPEALDVDSLSAISSLRSLSLGSERDWRSTCFIPDINSVSQLQHLNVYGCTFNARHVQNLTLEHLNVDNSRFVYIHALEYPNALRNITTLKSLALKNVGLSQTGFLNHLVNLEVIDLSENNLGRFDCSNPLEKLRKVVADDNRLVLIYHLNAPNLEELHLSGNRITSNYWSHFPEYLKLKKLVIGDNRIFHLRGLRLPALEVLIAPRNVIPDEHQDCIASVSCDFSDQLTIGL